MVQKQSATVNPAGGPKVTEVRDGKPYTRETFIRDLKKVAKKDPGAKK